MLVPADASLNVQETGEHGKILAMLCQRPMRRCQRVVWAGVFRKPVVMIDGARDIKTRQSRRITLPRRRRQRLASHDIEIRQRQGRAHTSQGGSSGKWFGFYVHSDFLSAFKDYDKTRVLAISLGSQKRITPHHSFHHIAERIAPAAEAVLDGADFSQRGDVRFAASTVKREVFQQAAHEVALIMLNHQLLEFREALESFATRQLANHIDRTRFAGAVPGNLAVDFLAIVFLKLHVAPAALKSKF